MIYLRSGCCLLVHGAAVRRLTKGSAGERIISASRIWRAVDGTLVAVRALQVRGVRWTDRRIGSGMQTYRFHQRQDRCTAAGLLQKDDERHVYDRVTYFCNSGSGNIDNGKPSNASSPPRSIRSDHHAAAMNNVGMAACRASFMVAHALFFCIIGPVGVAHSADFAPLCRMDNSLLPRACNVNVTHCWRAGCGGSPWWL